MDVSAEQIEDQASVVVVIASPLEAHFVARIAAIEPARVEVIYRPDLLPPVRYQGDHNGPPDWSRTAAQDAEWRSLLRRAEVLWDFDLRSGDHPLRLSPDLKWVQTTSAGVGPLVKRLGLADQDLIITTASGVHAQPLSEFVFGALLFHIKRLAHLQEEQRQHHWERFCSGELAGKTISIIGPGRIGRKIAQIARCFDMTVWAMGRRSGSSRESELGVDRLFRRDDLHAMLAGTDCLVLCAPHTRETENIIGGAELAGLKAGAVFINIGRGALVEEPALITALRSGQISFAALDVFQSEPLPVASPLWDMPNVLINPHSASTADSENEKLTDLFCRNLRHYLAGRRDEMAPRLNPALMY
jgi:phosphoglycerate dehydrogenase-like enzyme